MKQNNESITPLRKYIAIGYAVIALLIGSVTADMSYPPFFEYQVCDPK